MIQWMLAIWSLVPLPYLNPACTSGSSQFTYCWSLAWRILSLTLPARDMSTTVWWFEHSLALPFFGIGMKPYLFHSCSCFWVFQFFWHIECSTLTVSFFLIFEIAQLNSPLILLIVIFLKEHLISHSRMSDSRWMTTPLWLSRSSFFV